jgi:hypothetical protein
MKTFVTQFTDCPFWSPGLQCTHKKRNSLNLTKKWFALPHKGQPIWLYHAKIYKVPPSWNLKVLQMLLLLRTLSQVLSKSQELNLCIAERTSSQRVFSRRQLFSHIIRVHLHLHVYEAWVPNSENINGFQTIGRKRTHKPQSELASRWPDDVNSTMSLYPQAESFNRGCNQGVPAWNGSAKQSWVIPEDFLVILCHLSWPNIFVGDLARCKGTIQHTCVYVLWCLLVSAFIINIQC